MEMVKPKFDVGVVVARFQCPKLHEAHLDLLETVTNIHHKVIVILGIHSSEPTPENPLDFEMRKQMILEKFPGVIVGDVNDCPHNDQVWSNRLDARISNFVTPIQSVVLYGGRDSFIPHYKGRFPVLEFESNGFFSGSEMRKRASIEVKNSEDFRAGVIWGVTNRFARVIPTVDIVIYENDKILLGQKSGESLLRFIGGFADGKNNTYESDAAREAMEETGLSISDPVYIGSTLIDDPRYKKGPDKIKTLIFMAQRISGKAEAADDIAKVEWRDFKTLKESDIEALHRPIFKIFQKEFSKLLAAKVAAGVL